MGENFAETFPRLLAEVREFYDWSVVVAAVVLFAGLVFAFWRGTLGQMQENVRGILTVAVISVIIGQFPAWVDEVQRIAHESVINNVGANPAESHREFALLINDTSEGEIGFWDILFDEKGGIAKAIIYASIFLLSKLAWLIMWLAFLIQHVLLLLGIAVAPVFLSLFILNATRGIALRYVLTLVAILLWPLGWAVADLITSALLESLASGNGSPILSTLQAPFFLLLVSLWIVFSTIAAPWLIGNAVTTGAQIGVALLGGAATTAAMGTSSAVSGGVSAIAAGAGAGGALTSAGIGGVGGMVGGSMGGKGMVTSAVLGAASVWSAGMADSGATSGGQSGAPAGGTAGTPDYSAEARAIAARNQKPTRSQPR